MLRTAVSVIVPIYNSPKTLKHCVDSLLDQTFEDQEILLIDDGSTDESGDTKKDDRVRVIHRENEGLSSARNCGVDLAHGDWISFLDADDWFEKDIFRVMLEHGEGVDVIVSGRSTDSPERQITHRPTYNKTLIDSEETIKRLILLVKRKLKKV
jgi:glycosyltransferase involved in cell wall biosynthesis